MRRSIILTLFSLMSAAAIIGPNCGCITTAVIAAVKHHHHKHESKSETKLAESDGSNRESQHEKND